MHFKRKDIERASNWFGQAVKLNPDRETAYRYWGDALMMAGRTEEARDKFIEAIIAEPYNSTSYVGLRQWAGRTNANLSNPAIQIPSSMKVDDGKTTISIDPKTLEGKDGSHHWMLYSLMRATYVTKTFSQEHPDEKTYRHSLAEETAALKVVAKAASADVKDGKIQNLNPSLAMLIRLHDADLIEPYVLIARADQGIATDYQAYRAAHRDKLRQYFREVVISSR